MMSGRSAREVQCFTVNARGNMALRSLGFKIKELSEP